jgi:hypothetical protein
MGLVFLGVPVPIHRRMSQHHSEIKAKASIRDQLDQYIAFKQ